MYAPPPVIRVFLVLLMLEAIWLAKCFENVLSKSSSGISEKQFIIGKIFWLTHSTPKDFGDFNMEEDTHMYIDQPL